MNSMELFKDKSFSSLKKTKTKQKKEEQWIFKKVEVKT